MLTSTIHTCTCGIQYTVYGRLYSVNISQLWLEVKYALDSSLNKLRLNQANRLSGIAARFVIVCSKSILKGHKLLARFKKIPLHARDRLNTIFAYKVLCSYEI